MQFFIFYRPANVNFYQAKKVPIPYLLGLNTQGIYLFFSESLIAQIKIAHKMNQEIKILKLSNDLLDLEYCINYAEHDRINILGNGDPVLNDEELCSLNHLQRKIMFLKDEHKEKAAELAKMKSAYCREISTALGAPLTVE